MTPDSNATSEASEKKILLALKRCSAATIQTALDFQKTRDASNVEPIILGLLEREMPLDQTVDLAACAGTTRLIEDLGLDSLGLMEAVMAAEEVFGITIENEELRRIATLDDLHGFVKEKLSQFT